MKEAPWVGIGLFVLVVSLTAFIGPAAAQSDACRVGQELNPGDYCTVDIPGLNVGTNRFVVTSDGRGCYGGICAGGGLNLNGFEASRISGTSRWRIDAVPGGGTTNRPPRATGSVPAQTLTVGGGSTSVNVARYFTDADGDRLTYTARSSRTGVVRASVSGSTVMLAPVAAGTATVTVTARDPDGASATQSIAVTVEEDGGTNQPPRAIGSIPAQTLTVGRRGGLRQRGAVLLGSGRGPADVHGALEPDGRRGGLRVGEHGDPHASGRGYRDGYRCGPRPRWGERDAGHLGDGGGRKRRHAVVVVDSDRGLVRDEWNQVHGVHADRRRRWRPPTRRAQRSGLRLPWYRSSCSLAGAKPQHRVHRPPRRSASRRTGRGLHDAHGGRSRAGGKRCQCVPGQRLRGHACHEHRPGRPGGPMVRWSAHRSSTAPRGRTRKRQPGASRHRFGPCTDTVGGRQIGVGERVPVFHGPGR